LPSVEHNWLKWSGYAGTLGWCLRVYG